MVSMVDMAGTGGKVVCKGGTGVKLVVYTGFNHENLENL